MKKDDFVRALSEVDDDLIQEVLEKRQTKHKRSRLPAILALAAAVLILIAAGVGLAHGRKEQPAASGKESPLTDISESRSEDRQIGSEEDGQDSGEEDRQRPESTEDVPKECSPEAAPDENDPNTAVQEGVPALEDLIEEPYSFAKVKDVTERLEQFTFEELKNAWGEPRQEILADTGEFYLRVEKWQIGEYSLDISFSREERPVTALTYRTADQPTIW